MCKPFKINNFVHEFKENYVKQFRTVLYDYIGTKNCNENKWPGKYIPNKWCKPWCKPSSHFL